MLIGVLFLLFGWPSQTPHTPQGHIQAIVVTLPRASILRNELELGRLGDGVRQHWMDEMGRHGIKQVSSAVRISWWKNRKAAKVGRLHYFSQYERRDSEIVDQTVLEEIGRDHLDARLAEVLVTKAMKYFSEPSLARPCQQVGISIFDDEWLPPIVASPDLNAGTDTNLEDAVREGSFSQVTAFFEQGVAVNERNNCGRTVLFDATAAEDVRMCELLLERGADARVKDENGWTPLMNAAWLGKPEMVALLISRGASVDAKDNEGQTALMIAAERGGVRAFQVLLDAHPNVSAIDNQGQTALSIAQAKGHTEIARLLKQAGARE
jgi:hypothetical protein